MEFIPIIIGVLF
jgi:hypothetical protein